MKTCKAQKKWEKWQEAKLAAAYRLSQERANGRSFSPYSRGIKSYLLITVRGINSTGAWLSNRLKLIMRYGETNNRRVCALHRDTDESQREVDKKINSPGKRNIANRGSRCNYRFRIGAILRREMYGTSEIKKAKRVRFPSSHRSTIARWWLTLRVLPAKRKWVKDSTQHCSLFLLKVLYL